MTVAVLAKEPLPGRVKTRLCPPYSPDQAARLAAAALDDTLDVVAESAVEHRTLVLDGDPAAWGRPGWVVLPQRGRGLAERLANALLDAGRTPDGPVLLIGMDTPQLRPGQLESAAAALMISDAVLGPATDGGFWAIGVHGPHPGLCAGVPMSRPDTGHRQLARMRALGLDPVLLEELTDVDDAESARAAVALAPRTRFAKLVADLATAA